jgi:hypothetical protein
LIRCYLSYTAPNLYMVLSTTDAFGVSTYDSLSLGAWTSASGSLAGWHHYKVSWDLNKPGDSSLYVLCDDWPGGAIYRSLSGFTCLTSPSTPGGYTNLTIGGADVFSSSRSAKGWICDFRYSDIYDPSTSVHAYTNRPSGWTTSGVTFDAVSGDFIVDVPSLSSGAMALYKIRPVGRGGVCQDSSFFNYATANSTLLRGVLTGVPKTGGGSVYRWSFVDPTGLLSDLTISINPTSFKLGTTTELYESEYALNGSRSVHISPDSAPMLEMSWSNLTRSDMLALRDRSRSSSPIFLMDHNSQVYFGYLVVDSIEELPGTNYQYVDTTDSLRKTKPSRYSVSAKLIGAGTGDEWKMV